MNTNSALNPAEKPWKKRFFTIWFGQSFSMLGSHLVGFAFVWFLTEQTGSATVLAFGSLMETLPSVMIAPIAGALVDRWNRKAVMAVFDSITALFTFFLALLFLLDVAQIWHVLALLFVRSTCGQFQWAAMSASTTLMVPRRHLSRVSGANQSLHGTIRIIAPALGAFLIASMPMEGILLIDVATAILAVGPLLFFRIPQPIQDSSPSAIASKPSLWQDLQEGWRYVTGWPALMGVIFLAMLVNFLINPAFSLLPLLVTDHFGKGAYELGFVNSALGVGIIIGGLVLSAWGGFKNRFITSLVALSIAGLSVLLVGLAPASHFILAVVGMSAFGFLNPMINGPLFAVLQTRVEPDIQGRVLTFLQAGAGFASPLGLAIAGPIADATHPQFWFILAGILTFVAGALSFLVRDIRTFSKEEPSDAPGLP